MIATFLCAIWIIGDTGTKKRCICSVHDDMAKAKDLLNSFEKEAVVVKAVVVYLGAEVRENAEWAIYSSVCFDCRLNGIRKVE